MDERIPLRLAIKDLYEALFNIRDDMHFAGYYTHRKSLGGYERPPGYNVNLVALGYAKEHGLTLRQAEQHLEELERSFMIASGHIGFMINDKSLATMQQLEDYYAVLKTIQSNPHLKAFFTDKDGYQTWSRWWIVGKREVDAQRSTTD